MLSNARTDIRKQTQIIKPSAKRHFGYEGKSFFAQVASFRGIGGNGHGGHQGHVHAKGVFGKSLDLRLQSEVAQARNRQGCGGDGTKAVGYNFTTVLHEDHGQIHTELQPIREAVRRHQMCPHTVAHQNGFANPRRFSIAIAQHQRVQGVAQKQSGI